MTNIKTSLIVAMADNNCIGKDNKMPWHISDDLKRFKSLTMGHPVIMGRKTFESILEYLNKPLPGRDNIVISRSGYKTSHDAHVAPDIESAIEHARQKATKAQKKEIFIIGGAQIYTQSIAWADKIHMTKIHNSVEGDAFFPDITPDEWTQTTRIDHLKNDPPYSFITLKRQH